MHARDKVIAVVGRRPLAPLALSRRGSVKKCLQYVSKNAVAAGRADALQREIDSR